MDNIGARNNDIFNFLAKFGEIRRKNTRGNSKSFIHGGIRSFNMIK